MKRLQLLLVLLLAIPVLAQRRGDFTTGHIVDLIVFTGPPPNSSSSKPTSKA
jgi:hypothetical protein